jgi:hypothetical protein
MGDIMLTAEVARFLGKSSETVRLYARLERFAIAFRAGMP